MKSTDISVELWKSHDGFGIYDVFVKGEKAGLAVYNVSQRHLDLIGFKEYNKVKLYKHFVSRLILEDMIARISKKM